MKIKVCIAAAAASCCASAQFGLTWSDAYNGTASGQDRGRVIAVDKRGNTYVAGSSAWTGRGIEMVVAKYLPSTNPNNPPDWVRPIDAVGTGTDIPYAIAVDDNGDVYVTGESQNGNFGTTGNEQFRTAKLRSSDGVVLWNRAFSYNNQESHARDLAINSDGHVFVTGWTQGDSRDILTIRYDASGTLVTGWQNGVIYNGQGSLNDEGVSIAVGPGNNVFVCGYSDRAGSTGEDWVTIRYAGSGAFHWSKFVTGSAPHPTKPDIPSDIECDALNNVYVCGTVYNGTDSQFGTTSYDLDGNERWQVASERALEFSIGTLEGANALDLSIDNLGRAVAVYVTGFSRLPITNNIDGVTIRYPANGAAIETWSARYEGTGGHDEANDIVVAGNDNVYVTGVSIDSSDHLFVAMYDRNGVQRFANRYETARSLGQALVANCAGKVYIVGYRLVNADYDFLTTNYTRSPMTNVPVTSFTLLRGSNPSGNLASLQSSDDVRFSANPGPVFTTQEYPVTLVISGTVASSITVNELCLEVEAQASAPNAILQRVEFYSYATSSWVVMDERFATTADSTLHLAAQYDPNEFLGPPPTQGAPRPIQARVMFKQGGPVFVYPWTARVDFVGWHSVD